MRLSEGQTNFLQTPQPNNKRWLVDAFPCEEGLEKNQALPLLSKGLSTSVTSVANDVAIVSVEPKDRGHDT